MSFNASRSPRFTSPTLVRTVGPMLGACAAALTLIATSLPARADSGSSVSLSASLSTAVGSVSGSLTASSGSSTGRAREVAAGAYTVVAVQPTGDPGGVPQVRVRLSGPQALAVTMPLAAAEQGAVSTGAVVQVAARPYGLALSRAADPAAAPFFLVLDDERHAELQARAVGPSGR